MIKNIISDIGNVIAYIDYTETLNKMIDKFCAKHDNAHSFFSLGSTNYFSLVKYAKCVV